eukprot:2319162-Prymnesium_polylepis.1
MCPICGTRHMVLCSWFPLEDDPLYEARGEATRVLEYVSSLSGLAVCGLCDPGGTHAPRDGTPRRGRRVGGVSESPAVARRRSPQMDEDALESSSEEGSSLDEPSW